MKFERAAEQPPNVEIIIADEIFVKQMLIARAGTYIPQHAHKYEHASMVAYGSVRVWKDRELLGDFVAPSAILIAAGVKHTFMALENRTVVFCIHNISRTGAVEIVAEHHLPGLEA